MTLHGATIPADSVVMLINGSATRDERAFPDPDRFDIDRIPSGHNVNFGYGVHSCLGAALARMEGRVALDVMLDMMPEYRVDPAGLRRRDGERGRLIERAGPRGSLNAPKER